jgi:stage V sporulation protein S
MNRFFSKLNLQDIKINPEGNRFPPDADESEEAPAPAAAERTEGVAVSVEPEAPVEDDAPVYLNGHGESLTVQETVEVAASEPEPVKQNGHAQESVAETVAMYGNEAMVGVEGEVLKVSARSRPSAVAGAIAGVVREAGRAEVQAIGAGATNQAVKAVAIARDYLAETGIDAVCVPAFIDVTIDNEDRTAIRLVVEPR